MSTIFLIIGKPESGKGAISSKMSVWYPKTVFLDCKPIIKACTNRSEEEVLSIVVEAAICTANQFKDVIISSVCPTKELRDKIRTSVVKAHHKMSLLYMPGGHDIEGLPYEIPNKTSELFKTIVRTRVNGKTQIDFVD